MSHILELSDGATAISFVTELPLGYTWCMIEDGGLIIHPPETSVTLSGGSATLGGQTLSSIVYNKRKIEMVFEIVGLSMDAIYEKKTDIARLLAQARDSQVSYTSDFVWLKYQIDGMSTPVYFDILYGEISLPENIMSTQGLNWRKGSTNLSVKGFKLNLVCKPFARGDDVLLVDGVTVHNSNDGLRTNYVSWSGNDVTGDVQGPVTVRLQNTSTTGGRLSDFWIGIVDRGTPSDAITVLEAEDADTIFNSGTITSKSTAYSGDSGDGSGGRAVQWSISSSDDETLCRWDIAQTANVKGRGGKYRVVAVGSFPSDVRYRLRVSFLGITTLRYTPYARQDYASHAVDLGVIDMIPWGIVPGQSAGEWSLDLIARPDSTDTAVITLDAVYLIPAEDFKFRRWEFIGYDLDYGNWVEDIARYNQVAHSTAFKVFIIEPGGLPLHIEPGQDGRMMFLWTDGTGTYLPDQSASIDLYHTPYFIDVGSA